MQVRSPAGAVAPCRWPFQWPRTNLYLAAALALLLGSAAAASAALAAWVKTSRPSAAVATVALLCLFCLSGAVVGVAVVARRRAAMASTLPGVPAWLASLADALGPPEGAPVV